MANYADKSEDISSATLQANAKSKAQIAADPYGKTTTGVTGTSASFRQRGSDTQKRVNTDTRVRDDANSGTAGASGSTAGQVSGMAAAMSQDQTSTQQTVQTPSDVQNASWQATRQPVDINSVRNRVLQSLLPQQGQ